LVFLQVDFPRHHDLDALRNLLPTGWPAKENPRDLSELTEWAVESRYPGDWPEASEPDAREAVKQAQAVWTCVCADLEQHGFDIRSMT